MPAAIQRVRGGVRHITPHPRRQWHRHARLVIIYIVTIVHAAGTPVVTHGIPAAAAAAAATTSTR